MLKRFFFDIFPSFMFSLCKKVNVWRSQCSDLELESILVVSNIVGKYCQRVYRTVQVVVVVVVVEVVVVGDY